MWNHGSVHPSSPTVAPVTPLLVSRRHIDFLHVAGTGCRMR
jgi:hypothetical protein